MHGTFVHLFINMRALGSSFWLREFFSRRLQKFHLNRSTSLMHTWPSLVSFSVSVVFLTEHRLLYSPRNTYILHLRLLSCSPLRPPAQRTHRPRITLRSPSLPSHHCRIRQAIPPRSGCLLQPRDSSYCRIPRTHSCGRRRHGEPGRA